MDTQSKLAAIKTMLGIPASDISLDSDLSVYLDLSAAEILNWMYQHHSDKRETVSEVPTRYEIVQIHAVVNGFSHRGAEGEKVHNENGINRTFVYDDMVAYIQAHVAQII